MIGLKYLKTSDGTGSAVLAHITTNRLPLATTLKVDNVDNWPPYFIATSGTLSAAGYITEASKSEFRGHLSGSDIIIDGFEAGFTDNGNTNTQVVIIKQTTGWGDGVADALAANFNDDGTPKASAYQSMLNWIPAVTGAGASVAVTGVTNNGNRNYDLAVNTDLRTVITPGMRLRTTRTVAAPTQCTSLNGTTQYWNDTTVNGMTFTDDFVVSAWVKLSSYAAGGSVIASRFNGSSGWVLKLAASGTGQVEIDIFNGGGGNFRYALSYQSLPLNKWVHVTAQMDASAYTATATTCYIMLDGVEVPVALGQGGTNPTSFGIAGNLEIGSQNGGLLPFPGKIAQVAIFSAKVTQATMRGYMSQGLTGTETSLVSAYSFNNSANDLNTTNANNLTAQGSAVATNADSPFGGQAGGTISTTLDHGIIAKVIASTITVNVAEGCTIPTTGGVSAISYSTYKAPYGFPSSEDKWRVAAHDFVETSAANITTFTNIGSLKMSVPLGNWVLGYSAYAAALRAASTNFVVYTTLSTGATTESNRLLTAANGAGSTYVSGTVAASEGISTSVTTDYFLNFKANAANDFVWHSAASTPTVIYADNAYL